MKTLIKGGRVIDPASGKDGIYDILIEDDRIADVAGSISAEADKVIDASGYYVMPGLIDLHVHFREPGFEHKETIRTGAMAAAKQDRKENSLQTLRNFTKQEPWHSARMESLL